ncbi:MAG TPA: NADH-quinone oxidoreductase subunit NuoG, partial [Acidimicrobiales bacterium]
MTDEAPGAPDVPDTPDTPDTPDAPVAEPAPITLTLDGRTVDAQPDELLITCAERHGTYIPRFCWHPRMKPVGMCRMCLVEVEGVRGLPPACTLPAAEGMVVRTDTPQVVRAQEAVLEFLLVNHPLDCPVCDRGGECPLQDQVMSHGPGESRFVEEKRHWEKPIRLGPLVLLDRERCIQCARCTRFCDEIAGEPQLDFFERGARTEVGVHPGQPLTTYFSGNTVQICPVGALLETPYRFRARPWDLDQAESTCTVCAVGCRMVLQSSMDRLVRHVGVDDDAVNQSWLCDKGRFAHEAIDSDERLTRPLVRRDGELVDAGWGEALQATARRLQDVLADGGPERVGVIGGSRLPNEDAYAWVKLAKGILGTDNVDAQLGDGLPGRLVVAAPRATIDDTCRAGAVVTLAADLRETLPVLYLRLRGAVLDQDLRLVELTPAPTSLTPYASASVGYRPGGAADCVDRVVEAVGDAEDVVLVLGRPSLAAGPEDALAVAARLAERLPGLRVLSALSRGNVHGALDMGMAPGLLPGRVPLGDPCAALRARWPTVPTEEGLDTVAMLRAAAAGRLDMLILLGADPLDDVPDRDLAERALDALPFLVATDLFLTGSSRRADVVLPAAGLGERPGTTTNLEGRVTRLAHKVTPPGTARPDWLIAAELAWQLGTDLGVDGLDGLWDEVELVAPSHRGVHRSLLAQARYRDGLVVPLDGSPPESRRGFGDIATDLYLAGAEQTPSRRFAVEPGLTPQHVEVRPGRAPARAAP